MQQCIAQLQEAAHSPDVGQQRSLLKVLVAEATHEGEAVMRVHVCHQVLDRLCADAIHALVQPEHLLLHSMICCFSATLCSAAETGAGETADKSPLLYRAYSQLGLTRCATSKGRVHWSEFCVQLYGKETHYIMLPHDLADLTSLRPVNQAYSAPNRTSS